MKLRWFWFDHVPPGIELTLKQRQEMKQRAKELRHAAPSKTSDRIRVSLPYYAVGALLIASGFLLTREVGWLDRDCYHMVIVPFLFVFYAYLWDRTNGPFTWRALHEMGFAICCECGYPLRELDRDAGCPECGWNR